MGKDSQLHRCSRTFCAGSRLPLLQVRGCSPHTSQQPRTPQPAQPRFQGCFHLDPEMTSLLPLAQKESSLLPKSLIPSLCVSPLIPPWPQFRYKTRVYKQTNLDEKQLAKLHTKVREPCWSLPTNIPHRDRDPPTFPLPLPLLPHSLPHSPAPSVPLPGSPTSSRCCLAFGTAPNATPFSPS